MDQRARRHLWTGFWANSLGTLASRVLGLLRDMATAALLGLGEAGVMDAFVIAFRIPNLTRRIFGEGALAASFLPVFAAERQHDVRRAWQLTSVLLTVLAVLLSVVALAGEIVCFALWWSGPRDADNTLLLGLSAVLLPYLVFICLSAQVSAALQAMFEFRWPAIAPSLLNVCWLAAAWFIAPWFEPDKAAQAYALAGAILVSGVLQLAVQVPALVRLGFRFDFDWPATRHAFWQVARAMLPITLGAAVTQINTLVDSMIAWGLSADDPRVQTVWWLGHRVHYPLAQGAAAAIYYGERFYQLPVGLLGMAIATVMYPIISQHASRGDRGALAADLTLGLRLVWFAALPAGIGIVIVARPMTSLLFERGEFGADDSARTARMIAAYATGVWAYCAIPLLIRAYYALGQRTTPATVGLVAVACNLALNLTLVWPLAEIGLAISTSLAAGLQVALLTTILSRRASGLEWGALRTTIVRGCLASAAMAVAAIAMQAALSRESASDRGRLALQLALTILVGIVAYLGAARALRMPELGIFLRRPRAR